MRKINILFELSQRRALDTANYKCQAIIMQFLKITNRPQALHIPRYGRTGFNIRVSNQKPTMWNSNLVIRQQHNVNAFTGFVNGNQSGEHKIAQEIQLNRLATNTPPVFFEADKPHFFNNVDPMAPTATANSNKKCVLDPFVLKQFVCASENSAPDGVTKDLSNKLEALLKSKNQDEVRIKSNKPTGHFVENDSNSYNNSNTDNEQLTASNPTESNNVNTIAVAVNDMTSHIASTNVIDLFSPKAPLL